MDKIVLDLEPREVTGKAVRRLRQEGFVPAVIHDHGKDSVVVMAPYADLAKAYQRAGKHHPISLKAGSKNYTALIKTAEFDPKKHLLRHVVFGAVKANEKVTAEIPVHIVFDEGNDASPAERNSLVVLSQLDTVEVEALPKDLPEALEVSGETLVEVGDQLTVADLKTPANVVIKTEEHQSLATVFEPSALQAANNDAGGTDDEEATETENPEGETVADTVEGGEENADTTEAKAKDGDAKEEKKAA
jgi:large subunit ribosomal protein L25